MSARSDEGLPPAMLAARRGSPDARKTASSRDRSYPALPIDDDHEAAWLQLAATRALLSASTPEDVAAIVRTLVRDLGAALVPARLAESQGAMQLDLSFGLTEPLLPYADPVSVAAMRLSRVLPHVVQDARQVLERLQAEGRRSDEAERDALTGLLTRRAWMRRFSAAKPQDAVCLIDLDHFKTVNDNAGHAAGDQVLRAVGRVLLESFRTADVCGRYGGDELACLAPDMSAEALVERLERVQVRWRRQRPLVGAHVGLSIGVAQVWEHEPRVALEAADRALYRVKAGGRDGIGLAADPDYLQEHGHDSP